MKKNHILLSGLILSFIMVVGIFSGCGKSVKIEIMPEGNVFEVCPGDSLAFDAKVENANKEDVEYSVTAGAGVFDGNVLKVNTDAPVSSIIKVIGRVGGGTSKELSLSVVDLVPNSISINFADGRTQPKIAKGENSKITLGVSYNPTYSTVKDIIWTLVDGENVVTQNNNEFTLKDTANIGDTFKVRATLRNHTDIYAEETITVVDATAIETAVAQNINYITKTGSQPTIQVKAFNAIDGLVTTTAETFDYRSKNENIATVDAQGKVTAHGHGEVEIEIRVAGKSDVLTTCKVFVMVTPEQIQINNVKNDTLAYGKADKLSLNLTASNSSYNTCTDKVKYSFDLMDGDNVTESGDGVAVYTADGIEFKKTGKVRVTITSDSSLNEQTVSNECTKQLIVNVNDGINITTARGLRTAADSGNYTTYNIINDIILSATDNFNSNPTNYSTDGVQPCTFYGNTTINGNGYKISAYSLPLTDNDEKSSFLQFDGSRDDTQDIEYSVKLYDLEVLGCGGVGDILTGKFYYNDDTTKGEIETNEKAYFKHTYYRGININGSADANDYFDNEKSKGKLVCKDIVISNVKVSGFSVGLIIRHGVNALVTDSTIEKCSTNGIESDQNQITFHNLTLGQVGAFGIEITPDDMLGQDTANPTGSAGLNYNETPTAQFTGYINSANYNNGQSTIYMAGLGESLGNKVTDIVSAITGGTINTILSDSAFSGLGESQKSAINGSMQSVAASCLKNTEGLMNFFQLIYINVANGSYANYATKGNTEGKFCTYSQNSSLINLTDLLIKVAQQKATNSGDWLGYKQYQYIVVDLNTGSANMGQTILVNQAYDANYTPNTNA